MNVGGHRSALHARGSANAIITIKVRTPQTLYAAIFARNAVGERACASCHSDAFRHYRTPTYRPPGTVGVKNKSTMQSRPDPLSSC